MWSCTSNTRIYFCSVNTLNIKSQALNPPEHGTQRSSRTKCRTHKRKSWRSTAFSLRLKTQHPRAARSLFSTSVKKLSFREKCPANWFVKMREGVRGETGREISLFFQSRQVKCAVRPGQWSRPFTCKDEVYGASRVLWPVFNWEAPKRDGIPSLPSHFPSFAHSIPSLVPSFILLFPCIHVPLHLFAAQSVSAKYLQILYSHWTLLHLKIIKVESYSGGGGWLGNIYDFVIRCKTLISYTRYKFNLLLISNNVNVTAHIHSSFTLAWMLSNTSTEG